MPSMKPVTRHTFGKAEKLVSRKLMNQLFSEGKSFFIPPFKVLWLDTPIDAKTPAQLLISVPRRNFKHAVDRNRIKRLVREAYRLHKNPLYAVLSSQGIQCVIALVMTGRNMPDYKEAEEIIMLILQRLSDDHEKVAG